MTEHKYYIKLTQSKLEKDKSSVSHSKPYAKKLVSIDMQSCGTILYLGTWKFLCSRFHMSIDLIVSCS